MKLITKVFNLCFLSAGLAALIGCNAEPVFNPPTPTVTITAPATIISGSTIKLSWSSEHVDNCTATSSSAEADFSGTKPTSGSFESRGVILGGNIRFHIECTGKFYDTALFAEATVITTVSPSISAKASIPAAGGRVTLSSIATAQFPSGALAGQEVVITKMEDQENADLFKETAEVFFTTQFYVSPHQIQIEVKGGIPKKPVRVTLVVPATTRIRGSQLPRSELMVFYNAFQVSELSRLLTVVAFPPRYEPSATEIEIDVPPTAFSDDYTDNDGLYVAVLYIGYTSTHPNTLLHGKRKMDRINPAA